ncbi:endonuclease/exonuclease/phosphatase family protein [Arenibacter sp. ARW7G5Y1]|uniref:endonuclease/exonuclease/phosphatase family protein n=1 Tax=Arenibacter sp. ARW7G5Y1 TaxID=2135619 RepID=UPI000D76C117|nr:endonuclease/exonuclease/phosphatase family protein [Arenibacter sp. ARW7G5Y1]PXX25017.1 endonuclease/exonuclease/phosphatase family metal-dependent hydrolase [Arenibacter sp. ARW7G5Y1]
MKYQIVKLFLFVIVGGTSYGSLAQADTLRVMSFNILHGATTRDDFNLDTIAGVINYYKPDLVALQEVDFKTKRAKEYDLPTELGIRTKMASLFARAMYYDGGEYGEAVLSKYTFVGSENLALPHLPNSEPRAALITRIKTKKGNTIQFVGTHLDHQKDETDKVMQAKAIVAHLGNTDYPTLVVGDLNAQPHSKPITIISEKFTKPNHPNAWKGTFPATGPNICIDHIMYNQPEKWQVLDYGILCENYASDHCIVIATLVFTP